MYINFFPFLLPFHNLSNFIPELFFISFHSAFDTNRKLLFFLYTVSALVQEISEKYVRTYYPNITAPGLIPARAGGRYRSKRNYRIVMHNPTQLARVHPFLCGSRVAMASDWNWVLFLREIRVRQ